MILDRSRCLRVGKDWTEILDLHYQLLVMDEIGMIITTIVVTIAVNDRESGIKIGIWIGDLLLRVGRLLRLRLLLLGRDRGKDPQCRIISRDDVPMRDRRNEEVRGGGRGGYRGRARDRGYERRRG